MKTLLIFVALIYVHANGQNMTPLGGGVHTQGEVMAVAKDTANHLTYIGGTFTSVNGVLANSIAKYDGVNWTPLGSGIIGTVISMKIIGSDLYVVGKFDIAGGLTVNNIAKWDGTGWSALGQGLPYVIREIEYFQNKIYVTGFHQFGSITYLASFDGNSWNQNLGTFDRNVNGLLIYHNLLLIYGYFNIMNTDSVHGLIGFDGTNFHSFPQASANTVKDLVVVDTTVFVLTESADSLKYFDGTQWQFYFQHNGSDYSIKRLFSFQNTLGILCDSLPGYPGSTAYSIMKLFQPQNFSPLLSMMNPYLMFNVERILSIGNEIHLVGNMRYIEDYLSISYFYYNGSSWSNPGKPSGLSYLNGWYYSEVMDLLKDSISGNIYTAGYFLFAGDTFAPNIARWDGSTWHTMGDGFSSAVTKILFFNNQLYAFGYFRRTGANWVGRCARWNGSAWVPVGTGIGFNGTVYDAVIYNNKLYACGDFTSVDGIPVNYIARFNGVSWEPAGDDSLDSKLNRLIVFDNKLIAATEYDFHFQSGQYSSLAVMDSTGSWQMMAPNYYYGINSLIVYNGDLFAGNGGGPEFDFFKWDGTQLNLVTSIPTNFQNSNLIEYRGNLYVTVIGDGFYQYNDSTTNFTLVSSSFQPNDFIVDSQSDYAGGLFPFYYNGSNSVDLNSMVQFTYSTPSLVITANVDSICEHGYVYYSEISSDPLLHLSWHLPGALPDTLSFGSPIVQYNIPGIYSAYLVATNLAGSDTIYFNGTITVVPCISSVDDEINSKASVSPNPFTSELHFNSGTALQKISVCDLSGKIVLAKKTDQNSINLSMLDPGVYFMTCYSENSIQIFRVIKQ